jgi:hypothetical protein
MARPLNEKIHDFGLQYREGLLHRELRHERRARNVFATLALVGWVLALAALGGAV